MNQAHSRFDHYIDKISQQMQSATIHTNPALSLYLADNRTALFQLEGLCRLYAVTHKEERFEKIGAKVKTLEDLLGKVDYYAVFYKSFSTIKDISQPIRQYCYTQYLEACNQTNDLLIEDGWLNGKRIEKIGKQLKKVDWAKPEQEARSLATVLSDELMEIEVFFKKVLNDLDHIEEDIHEARRKIRWIGIYAQALQGGIILHAKGKVDTKLKKYQTPEIVNSKYNLLTPPPKDVIPVSFDKPHFYAISFLIKSLGDLKDSGLKNHILIEAIQQLEILPYELAKEQVKLILRKNYQDDNEILNAAGSLMQQFIEDKILGGLMIE